MTEQPDRDPRAALAQAALPGAPDSLRQRLEQIAAGPPAPRKRTEGMGSTRRLVAILGLAAAVAIFGALMMLTSGRAPIKATAMPTTVDGLAVMTVSQALAAHQAGTLPDGRAAVGGYWSNGSVGHSCVPSIEQVGDLEMRCIDGEFGITEQPEPIWVVDQFGYITYVAQGPHLTPWIPNELEGVPELFSLPIINGQRYPPVPIVVLGHFDDPRAAECGPGKRQLCLDRLVLDRIVVFDTGSVATPGISPSPTPFPNPEPSALFDMDVCAGDVPYSFIGWTTTRELELPFDRPGHVYAMVTRDVIQLTEGSWQTDPNGSGHKYQIWGQRICISEENPHGDGGLTFGSVPSSTYVLWDDGLRTPGSNPVRPAASG